jgi:hypothetical protein
MTIQALAQLDIGGHRAKAVFHEAADLDGPVHIAQAVQVICVVAGDAKEIKKEVLAAWI